MTARAAPHSGSPSTSEAIEELCACRCWGGNPASLSRRKRRTSRLFAGPAGGGWGSIVGFSLALRQALALLIELGQPLGDSGLVSAVGRAVIGGFDAEVVLIAGRRLAMSEDFRAGVVGVAQALGDRQRAGVAHVGGGFGDGIVAGAALGGAGHISDGL